MRISLMFWNTARTAPNTEISSLAGACGANVIVLAEYAGDPVELLKELQSHGLDFHLIPTIGCERITLLTSFLPKNVRHSREADRYTFKEIVLPGVPPVLLCLVHLPSKLRAEDVDQLHGAWYVKQDIELAEVEAKHSNTLVLGDFNMNPFDDGMVSAAALNSVPSLEVANRESRVVQGRTHSFFYNPMWNLLGDFDGIPGTYFHKSPGYLSHYWNLLDQVLLRPSIATALDRDSLKIQTKAGSKLLVCERGRPTVSDHLPISFTLDLTKAEAHEEFVAR